MFRNFTTTCCSNLSLQNSVFQATWDLSRAQQYAGGPLEGHHASIAVETEAVISVSTAKKKHPSNFQDFWLNVLEGDDIKGLPATTDEIYNHWSE